MKTGFVLPLLIGLLLREACAQDLDHAQLPRLFLDAPRVLPASVRPTAANVTRSRLVRLNERLLTPGRHSLRNPGARLAANLFDDRDRTVVVDDVRVSGPGGFTAIGRVEGLKYSVVILASVEEAMAGTIILPGRKPIQVQYVGDGLHRINEVEPLPAGWCGAGMVGIAAGRPQIAPANKQAIEDDSAESSSGGGGGSPPPVIDFLVVYTQRALTGAGWDAGIKALMEYAVAENNFCYANSQIEARWNIAGHAPVSYTESGDLGLDWLWLSRSTTVASLKNQFKADVVMLIVEYEQNGFAGMAGADESGHGWTVFLRPYVTSQPYLVTHEVGHVLGAGHDRLTCETRSQWAGCGAYEPFSYGHRFQAGGVTYHTVMSYEPGIAIPYFSNPNVLFHDVPTGVAEGATSSADNARTINLWAPEVAKLMEPVCRFELAAQGYETAERAGVVTLEVRRTGNTNTTGTVEFYTLDGSAAAGKDFTSASGLLTFDPGEDLKSLNVSILDNSKGDGDRTFYVSLRRPMAGTALGWLRYAPVMIRDDEVYFQFTQTECVAFESESEVSLFVRREGNTLDPVTVDFSTVDGSAVEGTDYTGAGGTLAYAASETERSISIKLVANSLREPDRQFSVQLKNPSSGDVVSPGNATVTVADDDRPGSLDLGFSPLVGLADWLVARTERPDGRVLFAGRFYQPGGGVGTFLKQYQPDGSADPQSAPVEFRNTIEPDPAVSPARITRIAPQADGKLLVAGEFASVNGVPRHNLARLNADGTLDPSFTAGTDSVTGISLRPDGKILIFGAFQTVNGASKPYLARLNADGSLDSTFQSAPDPDSYYVTVPAVQSDGKIIVGGLFFGFEGVDSPFLARLLPDGKLDRTFKGRVDGMVGRLIVALPDDRLLIAGGFTSPLERIARLNPDGSLDSTFQASVAFNAPIDAMARTPDGKIIVGGAFTSVGSPGRDYLVRLNHDGSLDTTFDTGRGPNDQVDSIFLEANGGVVVAGLFTAINNRPALYLARLRNDISRPVFAAPRMLATGGVELKLDGSPGSGCVLESSLDLLNWVPVWTNTFLGASLEWSEPALNNARFYRALLR